MSGELAIWGYKEVNSVFQTLKSTLVFLSRFPVSTSITVAVLPAMPLSLK